MGPRNACVGCSTAGARQTRACDGPVDIRFAEPHAWTPRRAASRERTSEGRPSAPHRAQPRSNGRQGVEGRIHGTRAGAIDEQYLLTSRWKTPYSSGEPARSTGPRWARTRRRTCSKLEGLRSSLNGSASPRSGPARVGPPCHRPRNAGRPPRDGSVSEGHNRGWIPPNARKDLNKDRSPVTWTPRGGLAFSQDGGLLEEGWDNMFESRAWRNATIDRSSVPHERDMKVSR